MTNQRSFLPNDDATLVCKSDANSTVVNYSDWRAERDAYVKEMDIRRLMMNRTGVCG
jgi:hypothetical protein